MTQHELKTESGPFQAVLNGTKTFEHRHNDRDFHVGDTVILREWGAGGYSGRRVHAKVGYVLLEEYGVADGFCVFSLLEVRVLYDAR